MDDPLLGSVVSNYRIDRFLGGGGMGKVYLGADLNMGERPVAIKVLHDHLSRDEQIQRRFKNEAIVLGKLNHPNIVTVYLFDVDHLMIVMEHVDGPALDEVIEGMTGPLVFDRLFVLFDPVLRAVDYAHRQGVIHRDMKPSNIMISTIDGQVIPKVMDFGIAKILGDGARMTATGGALGTMTYCAPEQIENAGNIDHRADIYALGVTLYEMATGRVPFEGDSEFSVMKGHIDGNPPPPSEIYPGVTAELETIILRAMARDPDNRYQSVADLRGALDALARETGVSRDRAQEALLASLPSGETPAPAPAEAEPEPAPVKPARTVVERPAKPAKTVVERPAPAATVVEPETRIRSSREVPVRDVAEAPRGGIPKTTIGVIAGAVALAVCLLIYIGTGDKVPPPADPPPPQVAVAEGKAPPEPAKEPEPAKKPGPLEPKSKPDPPPKEWSGPATAKTEQPVVYRARLSRQDHWNSRGRPVKRAAEIIRQDRANYHKFYKRDPEDQNDSVFSTTENRSRRMSLLKRAIPSYVATQIKRGTPLIEVKIWSDRMTVSIISQ